MRALVRGTRGSTEVDGATLRAKLGLFDTWAYFTTVTSKASRAPSGAHAAAAREHMLSGTVTPARRGAIARVQALRGGRWVDAGSAWIGRGGAYRWPVVHAGTYRVVFADAPGPAIRFSGSR
jgi:stage II sporulation protein D